MVQSANFKVQSAKYKDYMIDTKNYFFFLAVTTDLAIIFVSSSASE